MGRAALAVLVTAFVITWGSVAFPAEVTSENSRAALYGAPVAFLEVDTYLTPPTDHRSRVYLDLKDYGTDVHWAEFMLSWTSIALALAIVMALSARARRRARARPPHPSARLS